MSLKDLIRRRSKSEPAGFASAIPAIPAIPSPPQARTIARIATIAIANPGDAKTEGTEAPPSSPGLPPLSPASAARRQKVLALLARDGTRYAALVEDPNTDPVVLALATPDGTAELLIPRDRYDPFKLLERMREWETDPDPLWWRVRIQEPSGRAVEVDAPSGWTLGEAQAYAQRYHGPGCAVTPIAGLPKPRAPVDLDEALRTACVDVAGITPEVFRSLLSPEDLDDIVAGAIHRKTLKAYAQSFAEGMRSGRVVVLPGRPPS